MKSASSNLPKFVYHAQDDFTSLMYVSIFKQINVIQHTNWGKNRNHMIISIEIKIASEKRFYKAHVFCNAQCAFMIKGYGVRHRRNIPQQTKAHDKIVVNLYQMVKNDIDDESLLLFNIVLETLNGVIKWEKRNG